MEDNEKGEGDVRRFARRDKEDRWVGSNAQDNGQLNKDRMQTS